ncbi:antibiotic biosynthesis monooxygenase family protein [Streptomyces sp. enrichment culture]|uniref:antibiotic biosynthesis monooxygenase family protein n=1 Tax=Streptomyces sp. enrichment culture TaxID=1795815 RepID=UPI003F54BD98
MTPEGGAGVRVLVWYREPRDDPAALYRAFEEAERAMRSTPGLIRSELLCSVVHPGSVAVHSEWTGLDAFLAWERGPDHRRDTAPLRPYQDTGRDRVYDVYTVTGKPGDGTAG